MKIIEAKKEQLLIVQNLAYTIWPVAYGEILSEAQLEYMLTKFYDLSFLESQMKNGHVFLLAEEDEVYYGFASYELNCNATSLTKIHKIYISTTSQGKGLGKKLINFIKNKALLANNTGVFLNVNRFNKAVDFYKKNKFVNIQTLDIEIGEGYLMEDYVMELIF